ncbi:MAG: hydrolase [Waddliaceae bacterium]|nr:hydrolase [Waddliaceae bacterium]
MTEQNGSTGKLLAWESVREQGFFDKNHAVRVCITILFAIGLFCFLHYREVRVEVLELGTDADRYVVAQIDFEFLDENAKAIRSQEAVRYIGKIYKLNEQETRQKRIEFENYIRRDQDWRKSVEQVSFEEIYQALDLLEDVLLQARFSDTRTIQQLQHNHFYTTYYQAFGPTDIASPVQLPEDIWDSFLQIAFVNEIFQEGTVNLIDRFFSQEGWRLEEDILAQQKLHAQIQGRVPDQYTRIRAGSRIIDQGERVEMRHIMMLQAMKKELGDRRNLWHPLTIFGSTLLVGIALFMGKSLLKLYFPEMLKSNRKLFLLVTILLMTLALSKLCEYFLVEVNSKFVDTVRFPLLLPFAAILLTSLMGPGLAMLASVFLAVGLTLTLAIDRQGFMLINLIAAMTAVVHTHSITRRNEIFILCFRIWCICGSVIIAMHCYENTALTWVLWGDLLSSMVFMLVTGILVVGILPLLESGFEVLTDVNLMEYMDPNNEMLRRLSIEAPGTYQHSVVVGNLAEAAASAIGANGLFCRAAALYHDIGKLATPHYFTENQQTSMNMHQLLTPTESARVIIAHVSEGVSMARKIGLPEKFIDIIKEHHGTTLVYYFYKKQLDKMGGDPNLVDEKEFRYTGPKPRSKESAILMIADSLEAASRSLDEINEETLSELIQGLIARKASEGQFNQCLLTFEELGIVKQAMIKTLLAASHSRIKYPKVLRDNAEENG